MKRHVQPIAACVIFLSVCLQPLFSQSTFSVKSPEILGRKPSGAYDIQRNVTGNVDFYTTNYGIFGLNVSANAGGGYWPRGSNNQYIFGSGFWFAAKKTMPDSSVKKLVTISYNPNSGNSWFVPGSYDDGKTVLTTPEAVKKYRLYFASDMKAGGMPLDTTDGPAWTHWAQKGKTPKRNGYTGDFVYDASSRNAATYDSPVFLSKDDITCVMKDSDLRYYEGKDTAGFPLGLQIEERILTWDYAPYSDVVLIEYTCINRSSDTLRDCYFGQALDPDIAVKSNLSGGASNDRCRYYNEDPSLNLALFWSNFDQGEAGKGFGILGISFPSTPAVSSDGFLKPDNVRYPISEQLGLKTFQNWTIADDPNTNMECYDFMSAGVKNGDNGAGDKRGMLASGPFHFRPNEKVRFVVAYSFALPSDGVNATGTTTDAKGLTDKVKLLSPFYEGLRFGTTNVENDTMMRSELAVSTAIPQPAGDFTTLFVYSSKEFSGVADVVDMLGKTVVHSEMLHFSVGQNPVRLNTSSLQSGVYFGKIEVNGQIFIRPIVVSK